MTRVQARCAVNVEFDGGWYWVSWPESESDTPPKPKPGFRVVEIKMGYKNPMYPRTHLMVYIEAEGKDG